MTKLQREAVAALKADGKEAVPGKGGYFVKGEGFLKAATVYRRYGIKSGRQRRHRIGAYGDLAWLQILNGAVVIVLALFGLGYVANRAGHV